MRTAVLVVLALAAVSRAQAQGAPADPPYPLTVKPGEAVAICPTRTIVCPAAAALCDDPSVAVPEMDPERGLVFRGVKPGSTLCSAGGLGGQGMRRVYRVTVR